MLDFDGKNILTLQTSAAALNGLYSSVVIVRTVEIVRSHSRRN